MLPSQPHGEDPLHGARAVPISLNAESLPPGEDGMLRAATINGTGSADDYGDEIENEAQDQASEPDGVDGAQSKNSIDFLRLVRDAEDQALLYVAQVNRKAWSQSLRAFHQEHYIGSKYTRPDWRGRSKLFVPKTRTAVRKDNAAVAASLFNSIDAINCLPGDEGDPKQRAAAAIMDELVNYRTDRSSGKASFPWFLVSMGARQDAVLTGICVSKQCWKQEYRKTGEEKVLVDDGTGLYVEKTRDTFKLDIDRPDMLLVPPENIVIDPSADWTDPVQSAAFVILKWPMQIEEIKAKQDAPINPWKPISEEVLKNSVESGKYDMAAIRRAREMGLDRLDETQTGTHFQIIWVYECFLRVEGEDWTFYSVGDQTYLTDPKPVREVYPEQFGERPLSMGYGNLEAHRIFPMSPVESWQPLQLETNDLRNLMLDAVKQNVMPISKVRRGRQIDLDQVKRRSSGSSIIVSDPTDVTWETPPQVPESSIAMSRELDLELDDLAGQQNYGSVQTNNALGKTLGGLKLAAGAANAVQEFDIRVWIETWASRALAQIVRLEQYYESDAVVLGLCGSRAQLFQKYGINKIDDELLEQEITVRISVGLGAGDPMQRLAKFQSAAQIVAPLLAQTQEFQSGQVTIDWEAVSQEIFGAAGYKDGGSRFFKKNDHPPENPMADLKTKELEARIAKDERTGKAAMFQGIASLAKIALGKRELEASVVERLLGRQNEAHKTGFEHGHRHMDQHLAATDHGHRHGLAIAAHRHQVAQAAREAAGGDAGMEDGPPASSAAPPPQGAPSGAGPSDQPPASPSSPDLLELIQSGQLKFSRDPKTGRINGLEMGQREGGYPVPPGSGPQRQLPKPTAQAAAPQEAQAADRIEAALARLEELEKKMSKGKRILRDPKTHHIIGVE